MRDAKRIPAVLGELEDMWKRVPDLRFGQFLINVFGGDFYWIEDAELIRKVREFYASTKVAKSKKSSRAGKKV